MVENISERGAAKRFGISRKTVSKMINHAVPPGYQRKEPAVSPKLGPFVGIIRQILEDDREVLKKQRHTAKRIFERLRDEHGYGGGYTVVREFVAKESLRQKEVFVPLAHPPGRAQVDFGEADIYLGGVKTRIHYFCLDLPHSDAIFVKAYPAETTEAFLDGHVSAFAWLGGVPASVLYDNTKIAVAKILGDGKRQRTKAFSELQSHYLFEDSFGRPAKGNDKGKVEGLVGYARRNFMVPLPRVRSIDELNVRLLDACEKRKVAVLRGHNDSIAVRLERDRKALMALPDDGFDPCEKVSTSVSSLSLVRYRSNDYSVPTAYGYQNVLLRGYVDRVEIACGAEIIARHPRSYEKEMFIYNPLHYLALLERKPNALDQAAPLQMWELPEEFERLRRLVEARLGKKGRKEYIQVLRCFRTTAGAQAFCTIRSYLDTLRKQHFDLFPSLVQVFKGNVPQPRFST
jgi:transposase